MKRITPTQFFFVLGMCLSLFSVPVRGASSPGFTENKGQLVDMNKQKRNEFLFYAKAPHLDVYFRENGITYIFRKGEALSAVLGNKKDYRKALQEFSLKSTQYYRLDLDFVNHDSDIEVAGKGQQAFYTNYYLPHCPDGLTAVANYDTITYKSVYKGIDFTFYFQNGQLKYDIVLHAQANINDIQLKFNGANNLSLLNQQVVIPSPVGPIKESLPKSFTVAKDGEEEPVKVFYHIKGNQVQFKAKYNHEKTLVIDPQISWTTYYDDCFFVGSNSAIDVKGNQLAISSSAYSTSFPTLDPGGSAWYRNAVAGSQDICLVKFDTAGVRKWATYYGGSDTDYGEDLKFDYNGNLITVNTTESTDIPTQSAGGYIDNNYNPDLNSATFIIRFDANGVRQWASYYDHVSYAKVDVDLNNNMYVVGRSRYNNPSALTLPGAYNQATVSADGSGSDKSYDMFIMKFNSATNRVWATNLGSTSNEYPERIHVGNDGFLNIVGKADGYSGWGVVTQGAGGYIDATLGDGLPGGVSTNRFDGLIYRFNPSGALVWGTTFGGSTSFDEIRCVTTDNANNIYVLGATTGTDIPFAKPSPSAHYDDVFNGTASIPNTFLARFSATTQLDWSTYFGASDFDGFNYTPFIGVNTSNNLVYVGASDQAAYPLVNRTGDYNHAYAGQQDVYICEFASDLTIAWSTYYGDGEDNRSSDAALIGDGGCGYKLFITSSWPESMGSSPIWVDPGGGAYSDYSYFTGGLFQTSGLISKFSSARLNIPLGITSSTLGCATTTTLSVNGPTLTSGTNWRWYKNSCGGTSIGSGTAIVVSPTITTVYYLRSESVCDTSSCVSATVNVTNIGAASITGSMGICAGASTTLQVDGGSLGTGASWQWYSNSCGGTPVGTGSTVVLSPISTTVYYLRAESPCGTTSCVSANVIVDQVGSILGAATASPTRICVGSSSTLTMVGGVLGVNAIWTWYSGGCHSGGSIGSGSVMVVSPTTSTNYYVQAEGGCGIPVCASVAVNTSANTSTLTSISGSPTSLCSGGSSTLSIAGAYLSTDATWQWYHGSCGGTSVGSGTLISVSPSVTTSYNVRAEHPCGNTTCESITLSVSDSPTISVNSGSICAGQSFTFVPNGAISYTYSGGSAIVSPTASTVYTVTGSNAGVCTRTVLSTVTVFDYPVISSSIVTHVSCFSANNGSIHILATNANRYAWEPNVSSTNIAGNLGPGAYSCTLSNGPSCSLITTYTVSEPLLLQGVTSTTNASCGLCNGGASIVATGGTTPYTYLWSAENSSVSVLSDLCPGTFSVNITDANACVYTTTLSIEAPIPPLNATITASSREIYPNEPVIITTSSGVSYSWTPESFLNCNSCNPVIATPLEEDITYCVAVINADGCKDTVCIDIKVKCGDVFIPTAFSPNNDGQNDVLKVYGNCINKLVLRVYDRWGEVLFESLDPKRTWDGTYKGIAVNPGVFMYHLSAELKNGDKVNKKGSVTLVR